MDGLTVHVVFGQKVFLSFCHRVFFDSVPEKETHYLRHKEWKVSTSQEEKKSKKMAKNEDRVYVNEGMRATQS